MILAAPDIFDPTARPECASCGDSAVADELLALVGGLTEHTRRLVLCTDCRHEEVEVGGEG